MGRRDVVGAGLALWLAACGGKTATTTPLDGAAGDAAVESMSADTTTDTAPTTDAVSTGDAAPTVLQAQYRACLAYFHAQCNRSGVCGGGGEIADPCPTITDSCPDIEFSPGSPRTVDSLLACADAWRTLPCADLAAGKYPSCAGIPGTLPNGARCTASLQCTGVCGAGHDPQHPSCGICETRVVSGGNCGSTGAPCAFDESCLSGTCVKVTSDRKLGETCGPTMVCAAPNLCQGGTCEPAPTLGQACPNGVRCLGALCTEARVCEAYPTAGMPCKKDPTFNRDVCADADACDETAAGGPTCVVRPGAGGACTPTTGGSLEQASCAAGLVCACDVAGCAAGTCKRRRQESETCADANDLCVPGTVCVGGHCAVVARDRMTMLCGP